jgi:hypothetical protein
MTPFSQRDPRWGRDPLGTSAYTIAQAGCLITAAASMLADFGVPTDPGRLNRWLRSHDGYAHNCRFRFLAIAGLGADMMDSIRYERTAVAGALATGHAVLAELKPHRADPDRAHWIRLLSPFPADWHIMDPWQLPGHELTTLTAAWPAWDLDRCILYTPNHSRILPLPAITAAIYQDAVTIHPAPDSRPESDPCSRRRKGTTP